MDRVMLRILSAAIFVAGALHNSILAEEPMNDSAALALWIENLLDQRRELWEAPAAKRDQTKDISSIVCPNIDLPKMERLTMDFPDLFEESKQIRTAKPAGTMAWRLMRGVGFFSTQHLLIYVAPGGYCRAIYSQSML
ncbi:hypothetical protein IC608_17805 [Devosia sp. PTR5]|uniref:Uncharacterized protein n=1 Tax=Devosia oryzisoli TaxID=2774138 RepID=A0A927FZ21_9HYPH|nr:hypothetical protein [Devosia oryzisoli]MBD8067329.1 hypothetical protein [Devosia oryzisoli]